MKAINIVQYGGPEELRITELPEPALQSGHVLIRMEYAGVNFIEVYQRTGLYPVPLPYVPGAEGAGQVVRAADDVSGFAAGDRVVFSGSAGSYAQFNAVRADRLLKVPSDVATRDAAALMLQGMTANYLVNGAFKLKAGDSCLVHAAAGGVGRLLVQVAHSLDARVIGTVSSKSKADAIRELGAEIAINYVEDDFVARVKEATAGRGVDVVYDSVGKNTFLGSLDCLAMRGTLVLFGQSSGPVEKFDPALLAQKGSLFLTRPSLNHYTATRDELERRGGEVFDWLRSGIIKVHVDQVFDLEAAAEAHRRLASRQSSGKVLIKIA